MMHLLKRLSIPLVLVALLMATGVAGCEFTSIEDGVDAPLDEHLDALAAAGTADEAEVAIRRLLNKVGMGAPGGPALEPSTYAGYAFSDRELAALAARQAAFVQGGTHAGTIADVHARVGEAYARTREVRAGLPANLPRPSPLALDVDAASVARIAGAVAEAALDHPEEPENALLLAALLPTGPLPASAPAVAADRELSPIQQALLHAWLHKNGDDMSPVVGGAAKALAAGATCDPDNTCCGGEGKVQKLVLQYLGQTTATISADVDRGKRNREELGVFTGTVLPSGLFTIDGSGLSRSNNGFAHTIGNELYLSIDGSLDSQVHTSCSEALCPGLNVGTFKVVASFAKQGGACTDLETCTTAAQERYATCLSAAGDDAEAQEACRVEFRANDLGCHNQGGGGTGG